MSDNKLTRYEHFHKIATSEAALDRFRGIMDDQEAKTFVASLTSLVADDQLLQKCEPKSILRSAFKAALLNLPIEPSLGLAYVVPFGKEAVFIAGYRGLVQLAIRTGQYLSINVSEVYEGETLKENRLNGQITLEGDPISDEVKGYFAYFKLKNGFEKTVYMSEAEIREHAEKFSKTYGRKSSPWTKHFPAMAKKTVLRLLINRWGVKSITFIDEDMGMHPDDQEDPRFHGPVEETLDEVPDFEDAIDGEVVEITPEEESDRPWEPEQLKDYLESMQGNQLPENGRKILAAALNGIFDGDKTARYELFKGMLGYASTKDAPARVIANALAWLGVEDFNDPPTQVAMQEARRAHEWALKNIGQLDMGLD